MKQPNSYGKQDFGLFIFFFLKKKNWVQFLPSTNGLHQRRRLQGRGKANMSNDSITPLFIMEISDPVKLKWNLAFAKFVEISGEPNFLEDGNLRKKKKISQISNSSEILDWNPISIWIYSQGGFAPNQFWLFIFQVQINLGINRIWVKLEFTCYFKFYSRLEFKCYFKFYPKFSLVLIFKPN